MTPFQPGNRFISYKYLEADSPSELEVKMLQIQVKHENTSFTPPQYVNNKWTAWYLFDFAKDITPKKKLDMNNKVEL